jgi:hypothetical protein
LYRSRTVCQPRLIVSSEIKTVDAERAYPFMNASISPLFPRKHSGLRLKDGADFGDYVCGLLGRGRNGPQDYDTEGDHDRARKPGERTRLACCDWRPRQSSGTLEARAAVVALGVSATMASRTVCEGARVTQNETTDRLQ